MADDDENKISQKDAGYGPGMPHCGVCKHFSDDDPEDNESDDEGGSCELVEGPIYEDKWCKLFADGRRLAAGKRGGYG